MNKNFLPSKQFVSRIITLFLLIGIVFGLYKVAIFVKNKFSKSNPEKIALAVKKSAQKDSNNNGIPDWEESLWGLDPRRNGEENKQFILAKRKTLAENGEFSIDEISGLGTRTDEISKAFFSMIMALNEERSFDEGALFAISDAIGEEIKPSLIDDVYEKSMLLIKEDSDSLRLKYLDDLKFLVDKYEDHDIGEELVIISQGLAFEDLQSLHVTKTIANSYKSFSQDLIKIQVPSSMSENHLALANNYYKTGISVEDLTQILRDPVVGMKGLLNYELYSNNLVQNLNFIEDNL